MTLKITQGHRNCRYVCWWSVAVTSLSLSFTVAETYMYAVTACDLAKSVSFNTPEITTYKPRELSDSWVTV